MSLIGFGPVGDGVAPTGVTAATREELSVSRAELPASQRPLITDVAGCLVWWPLAALAYLVIFPEQVGIGIAVTGAVLLTVRLAHLTWAVAAARVGAQRVRRADCSRAEAARSPSAASTAWS